MTQALGAHSPRIAAIRALLQKKTREREGRYVFEGPTLLADALAARAPVEEIVVTAEAAARFAAIRSAEAAGIPISVVDAHVMRRISDVDTPPGIVAVTRAEVRELGDVLGRAAGFVLVVAVSDPGNAGTLLRAAEAFGVENVIFARDAVEPYAPKVLRAAMGAHFRLRLAAATPQEVADAAGLRQVTGLEKGGQPIGSLDWDASGVLVVGSERAGLGAWRAVCDRSAAIPMRGSADSLNAAVAGSIALYEITKRPP